MSDTERSFGSVIYRKKHKKIEYLAVKSQTKKKYWGFPKGHACEGETGIQTPIREVFEETGLKISIIDNFIAYERYLLCGMINKEVTFYLAGADRQQVTVQTSEIADFRWGSFEETYDLLTYSNSRNVLCRAELYLNGGKGIEYREISYDEITEDFLNGFDRYEEIEKAWREEEGRVILKDIKYTEYWDDNELRKISGELKDTLLKGGCIFAAYFKNVIIGVAALENIFLEVQISIFSFLCCMFQETLEALELEKSFSGWHSTGQNIWVQRRFIFRLVLVKMHKLFTVG